MRFKAPSALLATAVLVTGLGGITSASAADTASAGGEVHACVDRKTRQARIVNASTTCRTTEFKTSWGGGGRVTCQNVSRDPAVLEWDRCVKGTPPAPSPTATATRKPPSSPTPLPTPTGGGWRPDPIPTRAK
ncbi:hypothetical protein [Streptosporangium sp. NPDC023615]|uniref:hypothetical protein n=1 Tax=Streptosporangium sp. NPDC023615 TaxID=3154794 RepID=UPI0034470061